MKALRVAVVTGTRAEFGLLTPVMRAIKAHQDLDLQVIVTGTHLLGDHPTSHDVAALFSINARVPMQRADESGRSSDAIALARGIEGCVHAFEDLHSDCALILGDRIEAFAAASAASVMGVPVAHMHGGDVAEGVADEAMRHAITKLAHLHLPATPTSALRIARMGEGADRIRCVGSPAADVVRTTPALNDAMFDELGRPEIVVLHHPCALPDEQERAIARAIASSVFGKRALWLAPNRDPGHECIERERCVSDAMLRDHLPSAHYTGLLKRLATDGGVLIGNSSSALIEAAICAVPAIDIGPRQGGRERGENIMRVDTDRLDSLSEAIERAKALRPGADHPYGDGHAAQRVADVLSATDFSDPVWLRKRSVW